MLQICPYQTEFSNFSLEVFPENLETGGTLYKDSNLSYSELEFDKAEELGIPVLVFIRKGDISSDSIDMDNFARLIQFKNKLKNSATNRLTVNFTSADDLRDKVTRSLQDEFKRKTFDKASSASSSRITLAENDYMKGAAIYKNFIRVPAWYNDKIVRLRVRLDGKFGSWRLKEELFDAYGFGYGDALFLNDVFVMGADYSDVDTDVSHLDVFVADEAAMWILENNITIGDVIEGDFKLAYRLVKNIASKARIEVGAKDAYIAKLIFLDTDAKTIIARGAKSAKVSSEIDDDTTSLDTEGVINLLSKIMR